MTFNYQYQPLPAAQHGWQCIRIATLHPSKDLDSDILVTLRIEQTDYKFDKPGTTKPYYEALSYEWGPDEETLHKIQIQHRIEAKDGKSQGRHCGLFPVRQNLLSALRHLRHVYEPRDLWIDAICINQDDLEEKGPCVAFLGATYQHADKVIVWLGPAASESDHVMDIIQKMGKEDPDLLKTFHKGASAWTQAQKGIGLYFSSLLKIRREDIDYIHSFFCRGWFDRLWVRQEVFLPKQQNIIVQCGKVQVHWTRFVSGCWGLYFRLWSDSTPGLYERGLALGGLLVQSVNWQKSSTVTRPQYDLTAIRFVFSNTLCANPRDRIYAAMALLRPHIRDKIKPDYKKTVQEVYKDAFVAHVDVERNLDLLGQCELSSSHSDPSQISLWPSWLPDWSSPHQATMPLASHVLFGRIKTKWEFVENEILCTTGVIAAKVVGVNSDLFPMQSPHNTDFPEQTVQNVVCRLLEAERRPLSSPYPTGGTVLEAYTRTIFTGFLKEQTFGGICSFEEAKRKLLLWVKRGSAGLSGGNNRARAFLGNMAKHVLPSIPNHHRDLLSTVVPATLGGRCFFHTSDGLIGLGPLLAAPGDIACVLFGSTKLILLRPVDQSRKRFRVVGECYVCGAMAGEAVLGPLPLNIVPFGSADKGWILKDVETGHMVKEDPRLKDLSGLNLDKYRAELSNQTHLWLNIEEGLLHRVFTARGVQVNTFQLF